MKFTPIVLLTLFCFTAKALVVVIDTQSKTDLLVFANLVNPIGQQSLGFSKHGDKITLNINHVIQQDSMVDISNANIRHSEIVVKLNNDSLMYFVPTPGFARVMDMNCAVRLTVDAEIANYDLLAFRAHQVVSVKFVNDAGKSYNLFDFTEENKLNLQSAAVWFINKKNKL